MKKVLVVDDDPALAELIAEFCSLTGFESRYVTGGLEALDAAAEWRPDLITLDIEMPGIDGIETLKMLQSRPQTSRIPVVIISVVAKGALEEGQLKGARKVFEKPLSFERLMVHLRQLVDQPDPADAPSKPHFEPYPKVFA
jgi:CheY-like chemotaxis protein